MLNELILFLDYLFLSVLKEAKLNRGGTFVFHVVVFTQLLLFFSSMELTTWLFPI